MDDEKRPANKRRCAAMIKEGIYDPESPDGIDFCISYCPYEYCVVFENVFTDKQRRARGKASLAKALRAKGVSVDDITLILGISRSGTRRYLKK